MLLAQPVPDPLTDIRDEVDQDVLPIFLEEAAELFPQAGEQVRAWRRRPTDVESSNQLRRTLHTFKGSARMAGAMRLGELTHHMESRLDIGGVAAPATPELLDALDDDLDRIAFVLEALREGKVNVPLPWAAVGSEAPAAPEPEPAVTPSVAEAVPTRVKETPAQPAPPVGAPPTAPPAVLPARRLQPLKPIRGNAPNCASAPT